MADSVKNTIDSDRSGYIKRERLKTRLEEIFGKKINVYIDNDILWFYAPRQVTRVELKPIQEKIRVR